MSQGERCVSRGLALDVYLDWQVARRLRLLARAAGDQEFACWGLVRRVVREGARAPHALVVDEIHVPLQDNTAASTAMDEEAQLDLMEALDRRGRAGDMRAWIHSHASFATFFSATDVATIEKIGGAEFPLLSICVNRAGAMAARLDLFWPVRATWDEIKVGVWDGEDAEVAALHREKCRAAPTSSLVGLGLGYRGRLWDMGREAWAEERPMGKALSTTGLPSAVPPTVLPTTTPAPDANGGVPPSASPASSGAALAGRVAPREPSTPAVDAANDADADAVAIIDWLRRRGELTPAEAREQLAWYEDTGGLALPPDLFDAACAALQLTAPPPNEDIVDVSTYDGRDDFDDGSGPWP